MTIKKVKDLLNASVLLGDKLLDNSADVVFSSDMMSDVLAYAEEHSILITGLCNAQVVRTAEMMDIVCIIFVRNKTPDDLMLEMAKERNIVILSTTHQMFTTCGILYSNGLRGGA